MTGPPVVLDAAGLDALASARPPGRFRALLAEAHERRRRVLVPTVVCVEVARGPARTRSLEAAISRHDRSKGERPPVELIDTDFDLARSVGAILHARDAASDMVVDAHLVAVCARFGGGLIVTSDPDDVLDLASAVPSVRIVTRPAG